MPDKIVQLPSGERVQFPDSMADADINAAITNYMGSKQTGAMQSAPGGPVFNARLSQAPAPEESTLAKVGRGAALGAASGAGIAETPNPVRDTLKNLFSSWVNPSDAEATMRQSPPMAMASGLVQGFGKATEAVNPILDNFFRWLSNKTGGQQYDYKTVDPEQTAHDITQFGTQLAMLKGGKEGVEGLGGDTLRNAAKEVMGEGKFKAESLSYQHTNALATKQHISTLADAVHTDAQQAMSQVLQKVDEAHPEGAFSKADIQDKIKTAVGDLVQVPEKLPPSVAKILKVEEGAVPTVGGRPFNLKDPGDLKAYQRMKASGAFTPEEVKRIEGSDTLTAEQLKQMRSDVGQELSRYGEKGTVGAALKKVYGTLSTELRGAAANAGVEKDWLQANDKYSQYSKDFTRKGPLKLTLGNQTAAGIMEPLSGTSRQLALETLQKYRDAGFNVDMDFINRQIGRYGAGKKTLRMSEPGKWDLILAGIRPEAAAIRQGIPRVAGSPRMLNRIFGEGAEIPAREVYPTKAAAMKAAKAEPVKAEPATEEDALEQARRRAPGAPPEEPTPQSAKEARDVEASKRREATSRAAIAKAAAEKAKKRKE